ncbi:MAG: hypothetical protein L6420_02270 [Elusimicrobia bacterium]|nr:hypothetical protein [Elusimicrobiota bacterium]
MKKKIIFGLAIVLIPALFLVMQYRNVCDGPSDFRDAPNSEEALGQLQNSAPANFDKDTVIPAPAPKPSLTGTPKIFLPDFPSKEKSILAPDITDDPDAANEISVDPSYKSVLPLKSGLGEVKKLLAQSEQESREILAAASNGKPYKWQIIFGKVRSVLYGTVVLPPSPGFNFNHCVENPDSASFVIPILSNRIIFICAKTVYYNEWDNETTAKVLSQLIIHEGAHLTGYYNECDATRIEVNAMRWSGRGLAFINGYMDICDVK